MTATLEMLLESITGYIKENGYAPSYRDIHADTGLALTTIQANLPKLEEAGFIQRGKGYRTIGVTERGWREVA